MGSTRISASGSDSGSGSEQVGGPERYGSVR